MSPTENKATTWVDKYDYPGKLITARNQNLRYYRCPVCGVYEGQPHKQTTVNTT